MDGFELRVKMYAGNWQGKDFIKTDSCSLAACRIEKAKDREDAYIGLFIDGNFSYSGAWTGGSAMYFYHDSESKPSLLLADDSHWLRIAGDGEKLCDLVSDPKEDEIPPADCQELVDNLSEYDGSKSRRGSTYLYRRRYSYSRINGQIIAAKSLYQAIAYASFLTFPLSSPEDIIAVSATPNAEVAKSYAQARFRIIAETGISQ